MILFFWHSEQISRDNEVTTVLALNRIATLIGIFFRNTWRYPYFGCLSSGVGSFTKIYKRNFEISWNLNKKGINCAWTGDWTKCRQICNFLDVSDHSFVFKCIWPLYTLQPAKRKSSCVISKNRHTCESGENVVLSSLISNDENSD